MLDREQRTEPARLALVAGLLLLTVVVYAPLPSHAFVNYDDDVYVTQNPHVREGLTLSSLRWTLSEPHEGNYHPLTMISHMLDVQLFGLDARGHHSTSLLLHLINVVLLFAWLRHVTGNFWPALIVAALFAVHPLNVQSVAWVAERKNVLSTTFWLLGLLAYAAYTVRPNFGRYAAVAGCLLLGLAAKPMLVTFPLTLLLIDWAERRGWTVPVRPSPCGRGARFVEKLPLFALVALCGVATLWAQRAAGAMQTVESYSPLVRVGNAISAYLWYVYKAFAPFELAVFYPHPLESLSVARVLFGVVALGAVSALAVACIRRAPWLGFGWSWYLLTLVPVIGIVQVGAQAQADRYAYVPLIGVFIALVWSVQAAIAKRGAAARRIAAVSGVVVLAALAWQARAELRHWKDSLTLFSRAASLTPDNQIVRGNLGMAFVEAGDLAGALEHFRAAVEAAPQSAPTRMNLANALNLTGRFDEARTHYEAAMRLAPDDPRMPFNFALALAGHGRRAEAATYLRRSLELSREPEARARIENKMRELGLAP